MELLDRPEWRIAVAFGIGLVIGAERERRKGRGPNRNPSGIRTFTVAAVLGGVAFHIGPIATVAFGLLVGATIVVAYALGDRSDPGVTSELALVLTYGLGALAQTEPHLALAVGLLTTVLLAYRSDLHRVVKGVLTRRELLDLLILAVSALVVLPMLPDRPLDPLGAFNPHRIWRLAVVMMGLTGAGHVAQRVFGPRLGLALAGLASGFVSASATVSAMAVRSRASPQLLHPAVAGATASMVATFVQMAILVGFASPLLLRALAFPLGAGAAMAVAFAAVETVRATRADAAERESGRAFDLRVALGFALLITVVNVAATLAGRWLGQAGVVATTGMAGFADVHAPSAAAASLVAGGQIPVVVGQLAVLVAFSANTVTKALLAWHGGSPAFRMRVLLGLVLVLAAVWTGFAVPRLTG